MSDCNIFTHHPTYLRLGYHRCEEKKAMISKTKERIAALKWAHFVDQNDGTSPLEIADLKALADSHTALLNGIKKLGQWYKDSGGPVPDEARALLDLVKQAEGEG